MKRLRKINDSVKSLKTSLKETSEKNLILNEDKGRLKDELSSMSVRFEKMLLKAKELELEKLTLLSENIRLENKLTDLEEEVAALESSIGD